jgi:hypothetical protein
LSEQVVYPDGFDLPDVRKAIDEWADYRKSIKKPQPPASVTRRMKQLETPDRFTAAVDYSIAQGWQGIFEENRNHDSKQPPKRSAAWLDASDTDIGDRYYRA